jgi:hypothetical protein
MVKCAICSKQAEYRCSVCGADLCPSHVGYRGEDSKPIVLCILCAARYAASHSPFIDGREKLARLVEKLVELKRFKG